MSSEGNDDGRDWAALLGQLEQRTRAATAMGGEERLARQHGRGRLDARERIARLCDEGSFVEIGALVGGAHPGGGASVPADALVGGTGRIDGRPVVVAAEDFTVQGGSIGHGNAAKRLRLVSLATQERVPLVLILDGAGERASNAFERYPFAPTDLQALADAKGTIPVVALALGISAGHGALCGMFADFIVMAEGASLFSAGPPLVRAAMGLDITPEELGSARTHATISGVAHNLAASEDEALVLARSFLSYLPSNASESRRPATDSAAAHPSHLDDILDVIPANAQQPYDIRELLLRLVDEGSLLELQPLYGMSMVVAFARLGGHAVLLVANQPNVLAGAITREAAEKAEHFIDVANAFGTPVVFLADNPGVMPGPEAERAGTLLAAARMYAAQRRLRSPKLHVSLRKAFGFGSSIMAMNPCDGQTVTLALPGVSLGAVPASGGAEAAHATTAESERMSALQGGPWMPADNGSYDRVVDPRDLRSELIQALRLSRARAT